VKASEIIGQLKALIAKIESAWSSPAAPASGGQQRNSPGDEFLEVTVSFWDVKQTKTGKPYASLKASNNERWFCFDEPTIMAVDPLNRGDKVTLQLRERVNKEGERQKLIVGIKSANAARPGGIQDDEIPF
jgi:hypothetical protein